jgi:uncharacterized protein YjiS (DUF1127 family)
MNGTALMGGRIGRWLENGRRTREHRRMLDMPDYLLRDIGITREDLRRALSSPGH